MLFRRHLVHALFLAPLLAFTTTTVASACQPLDWVNYDGFPSCVTVLGGQEAYAFEVLNGCPDELTLASSDCPSCVSPDPIPNGDRGEIAFGGPPDEGESVDIDWEAGDTSDSAAFSFPPLCPETHALGDGCAAAPGSSSSAPWALAILLAVGARLRSRRARLPGRQRVCGAPWVRGVTRS